MGWGPAHAQVGVDRTAEEAVVAAAAGIAADPAVEAAAAADAAGDAAAEEGGAATKAIETGGTRRHVARYKKSTRRRLLPQIRSKMGISCAILARLLGLTFQQRLMSGLNCGGKSSDRSGRSPVRRI